MSNIRNFCIIAHIDHGKSTLADRFLELTDTISARKMQPQILDRLDAEREHGITIKMQPVQMRWAPTHLETQSSKHEARNNFKFQNPNILNGKLEIRNSDLEFSNSKFIFNLIDTPGHIDFSYEVSRALKAVEGAILLIDASSGIQAQTLSVLEAAKEQNLIIVPVINKIDLPGAQIEKTKLEIKKLLGNDINISQISAKTGQGVGELLNRIIVEIPAPKILESNELKALVFDANFDKHRGAVAYVRVFSGSIKKEEKLFLAGTKKSIQAKEVGIFSPDYLAKNELISGDIGYIVTDQKDLRNIVVGDTITTPKARDDSTFEPILGFKRPQPKVYASIYPNKEEEFSALSKAIDILSLSDSSFEFKGESSLLLGRGFRIGALGLLHLQIIQERLENEFFLNTILTSPKVNYKLALIDGEVIETNEIERIDFSAIRQIFEQRAKVKVLLPIRFQGKISDLLIKERGEYLNSEYLDNERLILEYDLPLSCVISDLYPKVLSVSSGFASLSYEILDFREANLVKVDISLADKIFPPLSFLAPKEEAYRLSRSRVEKIKEIMPRQLFEVDIKAMVGNKVIAKERIAPFKKDVIAKLYGGDRTRKDKLLNKQKEGKKKMKQLGKLSVPSDFFFKLGQRF